MAKPCKTRAAGSRANMSIALLKTAKNVRYAPISQPGKGFEMGAIDGS
jgi:hypothetical protein